MRGLRENYPDAEIFFVTPLPNILQDYLMNERDYLLPQQQFADVILTLAREYDYEVIDLYNSNILDSHDANVVAEYIPDGVHGSHAGYQVMAEHFAAEIIEYYEEKTEDEAGTEEINDTEEETEAEETGRAEEESDSEEKNGTEEEADSEEKNGTAEEPESAGKSGTEEDAETAGSGIEEDIEWE